MATLILEDGSRYEGMLFGHNAACTGEVVFTTGMAGYQETLTDPANCGKIVCMTYPLIGNVGVNDLDFESDKAQCAGLVISELCELPSNWQLKGSLSDYLDAQGVVGLCGVDTRALARKLRKGGTLRGRIVAGEGAQEDIDAAKAFKDHTQVSRVTCKEAYDVQAEGDLRVAVLDLGVKRSVLKALCERGMSLAVYPADTDAKTILDAGCDAAFITSGPGNPEDCAKAIETVRALMEKKPVMGIALGHQVMALAMGGKVKKMVYGHHGSNQPVRDLEHGTCSVTEQNVSYTIDPDHLPEGAQVTHINSNDQMIEGLRYAEKASFSVQFIPDAGRGLYKTRDLYDDFAALVRGTMAK